MTGYRIHPAGSPGEAAILAVQKLTKPQAAEALKSHAVRENLIVGTILGVSNDGIFFTPVSDWQSDADNAFDEIHILPWILVHEILGRVPVGSTADFLNSGGQQ